MDLLDSFGGWLWSITSTNTSSWHAWNDTDSSIASFDDLVKSLTLIFNKRSWKSPLLDINSANLVVL